MHWSKLRQTNGNLLLERRTAIKNHNQVKIPLLTYSYTKHSFPKISETPSIYLPVCMCNGTHQIVTGVSGILRSIFEIIY